MFVDRKKCTYRVHFHPFVFFWMKLLRLIFWASDWFSTLRISKKFCGKGVPTCSLIILVAYIISAELSKLQEILNES